MKSGIKAQSLLKKQGKILRKKVKQPAPKKWKQHITYQYKKHCEDERVRSSYRSKITIGQDLLRDFYREHPLDIPVAFDKWFTNPDFLLEFRFDGHCKGLYQ